METQDISELYHGAAEAMDMLFKGIDMKLPSWGGYWHFNEETGVVEMHCKDGQVIDILDTDDVKYTVKNIVSNNWIVATDKNTPILGGKAWFGYETAVEYIKRGVEVQSEYMHEDCYLKMVEHDIIGNGKVIGTESFIALFNKDGYAGYYYPNQADIFSKWRFKKHE